MHEPSYFRISIKALVTDVDGRILLARGIDGRWDALGGGLEHDEEPHDGLRREILEEAGLPVEWISESPRFFVTSPRSGGNGYVAHVVYEAKMSNFDFVPSEEVQELRFFTLDEAKAANLYSPTQKVVAKLRHS
jgi:8-oxo-dGTP diphosphatase